MVERLRARLNAIRSWIAIALMGVAYRISPVDTLPLRAATTETVGGSGTRFRVERQIQGNNWTLYNGRNGGEARRIFEGVKARREMGAMTLSMNEGHGWIVRGSYKYEAT